LVFLKKEKKLLLFLLLDGFPNLLNYQIQTRANIKSGRFLSFPLTLCPVHHLVSRPHSHSFCFEFEDAKSLLTLLPLMLWLAHNRDHLHRDARAAVCLAFHLF
jgi:hypothetical protein